jgi:DNA helicase-2/ATP-dependent DNA helicase PcrA
LKSIYDEISKSEIEKAERILLPRGEKFNDERIAVIQCLENKDIKACPGSGKTTALLAKLLILADRMPFKDNKGICVLTHTNVAINEIKDKLGGKSDILFNYPNFFGTFQSFVDRFFTIPAFVMMFKHRDIRIDEELHEFYSRKAFAKNDFVIEKNGYLYRKLEKWLKDKEWKEQRYIKFDFLKNLNFDFDNNIISYKEGLYGPIWLNGKSESDSYKLIHEFKYEILKRGILSFEDAYSLAFWYINKYHSNLKQSISSRFGFVFIDEMQDTAKHQNEILELVFDHTVIIQKYGDPHQAIYGLDRNSDENWIWLPRDENCLKISQSKRFGYSISEKLKTICIEDNNCLSGNDKTNSLNPHIIIFNDDTITNVLTTYIDLIKTYKLDKYEEHEKKRPFKAIGWVKSEFDDSDRLSIRSYFPQFNTNIKQKIIYRHLISYIFKKPDEHVKKIGIKTYFESIINAIIRVLQMAGINNNERYFTPTSLLKFLKEYNEKEYLELRIRISKWIFKIQNGVNNNEVYQELKEYIQKLLKTIWNYNTYGENVIEFFNNQNSEVHPEITKPLNIFNCKEYPEIDIEVNTIHSVKGETHKATLYLETSYRPDKKIDGHESERIIEFLKGNYNSKLVEKTYHYQTLKMAYVGMSRPTHLLCLAVHQKRVSSTDLTKLEKNGWIIKYCK